MIFDEEMERRRFSSGSKSKQNLFGAGRYSVGQRGGDTPKVSNQAAATLSKDPSDNQVQVQRKLNFGKKKSPSSATVNIKKKQDMDIEWIGKENFMLELDALMDVMASNDYAISDEIPRKTVTKNPL